MSGLSDRDTARQADEFRSLHQRRDPLTVDVELHVQPLDTLLAIPDDDPGWMARPIWPADAYGVLGAMWKAGKTWMVLDLALSVATGGAWCDTWPTPAGAVLAFLGEGGRRKMLRRLRAIADHKREDLDGLPVHLSLVPPNISDPGVVRVMTDTVAELRPRLILLDPWFLAAPGVRSADLIRVGAALRELQGVAQSIEAALVVSHHWNQTGTGTGAERFSGAGMAEWGRVLMSVEVLRATGTPTSSEATLRVELSGDEIAAQTVILRRNIDVVGDPDDLTAPLAYRIASLDLPDVLVQGGRPRTADLALAALAQVGDWATWGEVGDVLAGWGEPRKKSTLLAALAELVSERLAAEMDPGKGHQKRWKTLR